MRETGFARAFNNRAGADRIDRDNREGTVIVAMRLEVPLLARPLHPRGRLRPRPVVIRVGHRPGGAPHEGLARVGGQVIPCVLGRSGIRRVKREGDGASPAGRFALGALLFRPDRGPRPRTGLPARPARAGDGWCDDPASAFYDRYIPAPAAVSHETLVRADALYDRVILPAWPARRRGRGRAIFVHVARPDGAGGWRGTAGCVAFPRAVFDRLLPRLGSRPVVVID